MNIGPGVLPLRTDGDAPLRFEKCTLRGTNFLKNFAKICEKIDPEWDSHIKNFLKIYYFSSKFSKKGTLRGTDFRSLVFLQPYLGLVEVQKGTLTLFARVPPPWIEALRGTNFFKDFGKLCEKI